MMANKFYFVRDFFSCLQRVKYKERQPSGLFLFQVRVICSAATPIGSLFLHQHQDSQLEQSRVLMDDLGLSQVGNIT